MAAPVSAVPAIVAANGGNGDDINGFVILGLILLLVVGSAVRSGLAKLRRRKRR